MAIKNINSKWKNYIYQNLSIPQLQNEQDRIRNFCSNLPSAVKDRVSVLRDIPPSDFYKFSRPFYRLQASSIESRRKMCLAPKNIFEQKIIIFDLKNFLSLPLDHYRLYVTDFVSFFRIFRESE